MIFWFILEYLLRAPNLQQGVSLPKIDGIVFVNSVEVYDVLEVPAYKHIHLSNCRNGNVLSVCDHKRRQRSLPDILLGESRRFFIQRNILYVGRGQYPAK